MHAHAHGHAQVGRLAVVVHVECGYVQTDVGANDLASDGRALSLSCVATLRRNCYSKTVTKCPRVPRVEFLSGHLVVVVRLHLLRIQLQANPLHPIES